MFVGSARDGVGSRDTCPTNSGARVNTTGKEAFGSIKHVTRTRVILHCQDRSDTQAERERERERGDKHVELAE